MPLFEGKKDHLRPNITSENGSLPLSVFVLAGPTPFFISAFDQGPDPNKKSIFKLLFSDTLK
jgi:hypothetical protein